jgi:hypothetical protein
VVIDAFFYTTCSYHVVGINKINVTMFHTEVYQHVHLLFLLHLPVSLCLWFISSFEAVVFSEMHTRTGTLNMHARTHIHVADILKTDGKIYAGQFLKIAFSIWSKITADMCFTSVKFQIKRWGSILFGEIFSAVMNIFLAQ